MKILFVTWLLLACTLPGCGDKANIIFGPDPVRQIGDSSEQFASMPEEDRSILFAYVAVQMQQNPLLVIGRRAQDVMLDARKWHTANGASQTVASQQTYAKLDITTLMQALKLYKLDNRLYPTQVQGLDALVHKPTAAPVPASWHTGGYIEKLPVDPWGNPYRYAAGEPPEVVEVRSLGSDGVEGGIGSAADISSTDP